MRALARSQHLILQAARRRYNFSDVWIVFSAIGVRCRVVLILRVQENRRKHNNRG